MPGISRTEENRKLVFLLPSIAFNEQNVKVRFKKTQKKEKQTKNTVARKNWLAAHGSGSQARTLVTLHVDHMRDFHPI